MYQVATWRRPADLPLVIAMFTAGHMSSCKFVQPETGSPVSSSSFPPCVMYPFGPKSGFISSPGVSAHRFRAPVLLK